VPLGGGGRGEKQPENLQLHNLKEIGLVNIWHIRFFSSVLMAASVV
jgi:hypothetical protein